MKTNVLSLTRTNFPVRGLLLLWFQAISGLTINVCKCERFPVEEIQEVEDMTRVVTGKASDLLATYLRLQVGAAHEDETMTPCC